MMPRRPLDPRRATANVRTVVHAYEQPASYRREVASGDDRFSNFDRDRRRETGLRQPLSDLLDRYGDSIQNDTAFHFDSSDTIHFARWVLVDPPNSDLQVATRLVFSCNHDGPHKALLEQVARLDHRALDSIYSHCVGYPHESERTEQSRAAYLRANAIKVNAIFIGAPDRTLVQIRDEARLREAIEAFLNTKDFTGKRPTEVLEAIRTNVFTDPALEWATRPAPLRAKTQLKLLLFALAILWLLPALAVWLIILRLCFERVEEPLDLMPSGLKPSLLKTLERREDIYVQNQFSQLMDVKPGTFRLLTLKGVLWTSNFLGRNLFKNGTINSIPSIHFYSWILLDGGKRLLFLSNFDGSWESYLGDFIDKAAPGLNGVLSNCAGFPVTSFLFFKGVTDVEHYKAWARNANIATQVWYTGYPTLNVKNVNMNSKIRLGLLQTMDDLKAADWLRLL